MEKSGDNEVGHQAETSGSAQRAGAAAFPLPRLPRLRGLGSRKAVAREVRALRVSHASWNTVTTCYVILSFQKLETFAPAAFGMTSLAPGEPGAQVGTTAVGGGG